MPAIDNAVVFTAYLSGATGPVAIGKALLYNAAGTRLIVSTSANRSSTGRKTACIALSAGDNDDVAVKVQFAGPVPPSVSGIGAGAATTVYVDANGNLARGGDPNTDDIVGRCDADGTTYLLCGGMAISTGGSSTPGPTIISFASGTVHNIVSTDEDDVAASAIQFASEDPVVVTGIEGGTDGRLLVLYHLGNTLELAYQDGGSDAENRIDTGTDSNLIIPPKHAVILQYNGIQSRWRVVASASSGAVPAGYSGAVQKNNGAGGFSAINPGLAGRTIIDTGTDWLAGPLDLASPNATTGTLPGTSVDPDFGAQHIIADSMQILGSVTVNGSITTPILDIGSTATINSLDVATNITADTADISGDATVGGQLSVNNGVNITAAPRASRVVSQDGKVTIDDYVYSATTNDDTPTDIIASWAPTLTDEASHAFDAVITAVRADGGVRARIEIKYDGGRDGGTWTENEAVTVTKRPAASPLSATIDVSANKPRVMVTGIDATDYRWGLALRHQFTVP